MGDSPRVGPWWHVYTQLLQLFFTCLTNFLPSPVITGLSGTPKRDFGVVSCPFCHRWLMPAGKNLPLRLYRCWFTIGGNGLRRHSLDAGLSDVSAVLLMAIPAAAYGTICNLSLWAVGAVGRREVCFCRPSTGVYRSVRPWHFWPMRRWCVLSSFVVNPRSPCFFRPQWLVHDVCLTNHHGSSMSILRILKLWNINEYLWTLKLAINVIDYFSSLFSVTTKPR